MEALNSYYCSSNIVIDTSSLDSSSANDEVSYPQHRVSVNDSIMYQKFFDMVRNFHLQENVIQKKGRHDTKDVSEKASFAETSESQMSSETRCTSKSLENVNEILDERNQSFSELVNTSNILTQSKDTERNLNEENVATERKLLILSQSDKRNIQNTYENKENLKNLKSNIISRKSNGNDDFNVDDEDKLVKVCHSNKGDIKYKGDEQDKLRKDNQKRRFKKFDQRPSLSMAKNCVAGINSQTFDEEGNPYFRSYIKSLLCKKNQEILKSVNSESKEPCDGRWDNLTLNEQWERNLDSGTDDISDLDSLASDDFGDLIGKNFTQSSFNDQVKQLNEQFPSFKNRATHSDLRQFKKRKLVTTLEKRTSDKASSDGQYFTSFEKSASKLPKSKSRSRKSKYSSINQPSVTRNEAVGGNKTIDEYEEVQSLVPSTSQYNIDIPSPILSTTAENTPLGFLTGPSRCISPVSEQSCARFPSLSNQLASEVVSQYKTVETSKCKLWSNFAPGSPLLRNLDH